MSRMNSKNRQQSVKNYRSQRVAASDEPQATQISFLPKRRRRLSALSSSLSDPWNCLLKNPSFSNTGMFTAILVLKTKRRSWTKSLQAKQCQWYMCLTDASIPANLFEAEMV